MDLPSEAAIVREIGKFLMNGSLYRGLRPVMWSPVEKTALAEAEIEYHDHVSPTLWARFPVVRASAAEDLVGASVVIWTTTPWTIPGNRAVAYGEDIEYALIEVIGVLTRQSLQPDGTIKRTPQEQPALYRPGERMLVAVDLLRRFGLEPGIV